jgi:hypothetical protein
MAMTDYRKIIWITALYPYILTARVEPGPAVAGVPMGVSEHDMDPVQAWCEEHHCGKRVSFDQFRFRSKREVTMFLLRWA